MTHGIGGSSADEQLSGLAPWPKATAIGLEERVARIARARELMAEIGADALIIGAGPSLRFFTGVAWNATERLVALVLPRTGPLKMICPRFELGSLQAALLVEA
ncbi:MAG: aminopeptidase P family N-terminal domain-containing protein, partial [Phenylobacterium sp.]|nr:aminopeptidase P family N-terminal domain-containing protein [Phenylobacterium sp.]